VTGCVSRLFSRAMNHIREQRQRLVIMETASEGSVVVVSAGPPAGPMRQLGEPVFVSVAPVLVFFDDRTSKIKCPTYAPK
jgi:hypothetical protein